MKLALLSMATALAFALTACDDAPRSSRAPMPDGPAPDGTRNSQVPGGPGNRNATGGITDGSIAPGTNEQARPQPDAATPPRP